MMIFIAVLLPLAAGAAGAGGITVPTGAAGGRLSGAALGTEFGSIGQRVSTTYTECCH